MSGNALRVEAEAAGITTRWILWVGRGLTAVPILLMVVSASMKFMGSPQAAAVFRAVDALVGNRWQMIPECVRGARRPVAKRLGHRATDFPRYLHLLAFLAPSTTGSRTISGYPL